MSGAGFGAAHRAFSFQVCSAASGAEANCGLWRVRGVADGTKAMRGGGVCGSAWIPNGAVCLAGRDVE